MTRIIPVLSVLLAAISASAAVPVHWNVAVERIADTRVEAFHGETLDLEAAFYSYGTPIQLGSPTVTLYYQTNGMGSAWWTAPGSVSGNAARATFTPAMDPGARQIRIFLAVASAPSNLNYRANAVITFVNSPGAVPNRLDPPMPHIDFAQVDVTNAPWCTEIVTNSLATTNYVNAKVASLATTNYVNAKVASVVTTETDPTVHDWAKSADKPSYTPSEIGALPATVDKSGSLVEYVTSGLKIRRNGHGYYNGTLYLRSDYEGSSPITYTEVICGERIAGLKSEYDNRTKESDGQVYVARGHSGSLTRLTITHTGGVNETLTERIIRDASCLTNGLVTAEYVNAQIAAAITNLLRTVSEP